MEGRRRGLGEVLKALAAWTCDAFFPERCVGCGAEGRGCCAACLAAIAPRPERRTLPDGTPVAAPYAYGDPRIRRLIAAYKFDGRTRLAGTFSALLARAATAAPTLFPDRPVSLVPVPLAPRRHRERGFNQAEGIAGLLLPHLPAGSAVRPLLERTRATAQQASLAKDARRGNVAGAFVAHGETDACGTVLLVDDVVTSGETLRAAAAALRSAGCRDIAAFAFAHAPPEDATGRRDD